MSEKSRRLSHWLLIALLPFLTFCGPTHTGPSEGVTVYEHPDFGGDSHTFVFDTSDFDDLRGPCGEYTDSMGISHSGDWDDCISSISVTAGWEATVYEHDDYEGDSLTVSSDTLDLDDVRGPCGGDWDDCISSIRIFPR